MSLSSKYLDNLTIRDLLREKVIPIRPFLDIKAKADKALALALTFFDMDFMPNTQPWCAARGTSAPLLLTHKESNHGVRLTTEQ